MNNGEFLQSVLDNLYDGVYFVDTNRSITYWNHGAERITGFSRDDVMGHCCRDNLLMHVDESGQQLCNEHCPLLATMSDGDVREAHVFLHHKDGHRVPVLVRAAPMRDAEDRLIGAVETFSNSANLLESRQKIAELDQRLQHDTLTGVNTRAYMQMKIENALNGLQKHQSAGFGLLFIDVDHFKMFNDTHGHNVGDKVLKMVANTLRSSLRATDSVGRWGGEEFVVLLEHAGHEGMVATADKLRALAGKSLLPSDGYLLRVTISVGAALAKEDDTVDSLVKRADQAMYQSKQNGRNRVTVAE